MDGHRLHRRAGAGLVRQPGAGQRGEPAKFSLDDGPADSLGATGVVVRRGGAGRHGDRLAGRARSGGARRGAGGEGRLVGFRYFFGCQ